MNLGRVAPADGTKGGERLLDEQRVGALLDRIDSDLALGRHEDVIGELQVLVGEHPLRERIPAQQMVALYRDRRQADASMPTNRHARSCPRLRMPGCWRDAYRGRQPQPPAA